MWPPGFYSTHRPDLSAYNPPRAGYTALGVLAILVVAVLLATVANLLIGIGAHGVGTQRGILEPLPDSDHHSGSGKSQARRWPRG